MTTSQKELPVLKAMANALEEVELPHLNKTLFVCVQHLLTTTIDLFKTLIDLGAQPANIFVTGKHYSTNLAVAEQLRSMGLYVKKLTDFDTLGEYSSTFILDINHMWEQAKQHIEQHDIQSVIVLDDGGRCLEVIPTEIMQKLPVAGIEQTTAGLFNPVVLNLPVPFIDVATCAAKTYLEPNFIVKAILNKIMYALPKDPTQFICGVIGVGTIGEALAKQLVGLNYKVYAFDNSNHKKINGVTFCKDISELIEQSNYIFGCTGKDITVGIEFSKVLLKNKTFISCTSEDKEFLTLIKQFRTTTNTLTKDPLADIIWKLNNDTIITILKGGFPANFDSSGESVPSSEIQLTRGLLLAAIIQSLSIISNISKSQATGRIMLHPVFQQFIVKAWLHNNPTYQVDKDIIKKMEDNAWVISNSGGKFYKLDCIIDPFKATDR